MSVTHSTLPALCSRWGSCCWQFVSAPDFRALSWPSTVPALFISIVSIVWMFAKQYPELRPSMDLIKFESLRQIARTSSSVFGISVIVMLISTAGNLILTQTAGPAAVPAFALPAILFALARGIGASVSGSPGAAYNRGCSQRRMAMDQRRQAQNLRVLVGAVICLSSSR